MKRFFALAIAFLVAFSTVLPASAAEGNFIELLEYSTVDDSGSNMFYFTTSRTVTLDVPMYTPLKYVDLLFTASDYTAPSSVRISYNGAYTDLTVKAVTSNIYRAYGTISGYYDELLIQFNASGSQYYTLQSCKVSAVASSRISASATFNVLANDFSQTVSPGTLVEVPGESIEYVIFPYAYQVSITVTEATDFDTLYIQGAINYGSINSIRCTYGSQVLPYTINYIDVEGNVDYKYDADGRIDYDVSSYGKYIFGMEIDLSGIERNSNYYCMIYLGGDYSSATGVTVNISSVEGSVNFADAKEVTWWNRFTEFMTNLFGGESQDADDYASDMESQSQEMQDAVDQLDQVTKPAVDDLDVSLGQYMDTETMEPVNGVLSSIFVNELIVTMLIICLTCALASYALFGKR